MTATPYRERVQATIFLSPNTSIDTFDYLDSTGEMRVIGVHIGDLTMHIRSGDGDAAIVRSIDHLAGALSLLRDAAVTREIVETLA